MELKGITEARKRLASARVAVERIQAAKSFEDFEREWIALLSSLGAIYLKLNSAVKNNQKSRAWMKDQRDFRGSDPLLRYLHEARNASEHGIEPVADFTPGKISIAAKSDQSFYLRGFRMTGDSIVLDVDNPHAVALTQVPPSARLVPIVDTRTKFACYPPRTHLGVAIDTQNPTDIANLALTYFETMLIEAEKHVVTPTP